MKLYSIDTGFFKLDGGAMFGVVPKVMWEKLNPPDENNLCTWAMRCLLVEQQDRLILIDTGLGDKQLSNPKFVKHYEPHGEASLMDSIRSKGFDPSDVTDVVLTHLHFDHCGGAIKTDETGRSVPAFPNATYWTHSEHWQWALSPNPREKASFMQENFLPLLDYGQLRFLDESDFGLDTMAFEFVNGHTEGMTICHIYKEGMTVSYMADLIPSRHHIALPYVMAYDVRPLETMKEKAIFLEKAYENDHILFFEHDRTTEACILDRNEKGIIFESSVKIEDL
jgi:glyoxylase-like metal-dependent hydrolase (beta-lactamase superfamily II)